MERGLMNTDVALDALLSKILRSFRGPITDARIAYPEVLHVEVRNQDGLWRFATQDATYDPRDPEFLRGRKLEDVSLDPDSNELRWRLSGGSQLLVVPTPDESPDDPPNWELITPHHITLAFGPGPQWHFSRSDRPLVSHV